MDARHLIKLAATVFCAGVAAALAGCGRSADGMVVAGAQAHLMPAAGQGVVYLRIRNGTGRADRLLRVETDAAKVAEIHETFEDHGVLRMRAFPEGLEIPAGATVAFEPGGKHVMLIAPRTPPAGSDRVSLTLIFERAGRVTVEAPQVDFPQ